MRCPLGPCDDQPMDTTVLISTTTHPSGPGVGPGPAAAGGFQVVGEAADVLSALDAVRRLRLTSSSRDAEPRTR